MIGRFITPDTLVAYPKNPQVLNRYSYAHNNPINLVDPSGHVAWFVPMILGAVKGAIIGAAIGAAISAVTGGNIGQGTLMGAIGGVFFGGTTGILGHFAKQGIAISNLTSVLAYAEAGAYAGAATAALEGGDIGRGALIGAASSGFSEALGNVPFFKSTGQEGFKKIAGDFVRQSVIGAVVGGTTSTMSGGDFVEGLNYGFFQAAVAFGTRQWMEMTDFLDLVGKVWTLPNTALGLGLGVAGAPFVLLSGKNPFIGIGDNAINIRLPFGKEFAITFGNTVLYSGKATPDSSGLTYDGMYEYDRIGDHEGAHTYQYQMWGPLYGVAYVLTNPFSQYSPFEQAADTRAVRMSNP